MPGKRVGAIVKTTTHSDLFMADFKLAQRSIVKIHPHNHLVAGEFY
ncbi:hypothetical protein [Chamaesiphon sp.]